MIAIFVSGRVRWSVCWVRGGGQDLSQDKIPVHGEFLRNMMMKHERVAQGQTSGF